MSDIRLKMLIGQRDDWSHAFDAPTVDRLKTKLRGKIAAAFPLDLLKGDGGANAAPAPLPAEKHVPDHVLLQTVDDLLAKANQQLPGQPAFGRTDDDKDRECYVHNGRWYSRRTFALTRGGQPWRITLAEPQNNISVVVSIRIQVAWVCHVDDMGTAGDPGGGHVL